MAIQHENITDINGKELLLIMWEIKMNGKEYSCTFWAWILKAERMKEVPMFSQNLNTFSGVLSYLFLPCCLLKRLMTQF